MYGMEDLRRLIEGSMSEEERVIGRAVVFAISNAMSGDADHKQWVIDQMVRILAGDAYEEILKDFEMHWELPEWSEGKENIQGGDDLS